MSADHHQTAQELGKLQRCCSWSGKRHSGGYEGGITSTLCDPAELLAALVSPPIPFGSVVAITKEPRHCPTPKK